MRTAFNTRHFSPSNQKSKLLNSKEKYSPWPSMMDGKRCADTLVESEYLPVA